jgi:hypothetical protein
MIRGYHLGRGEWLGGLLNFIDADRAVNRSDGV